MMHLSVLLVNTGDQNCDRPRPGRLWLRNIYHVHQRLSMAFPSREKVQTDPLFLQPYNDEVFLRPKFLYRIERGVRGDATRTVILVQSEQEPNWDYAFQNAPLLHCWQTWTFEPFSAVGDRCRFRIVISLTSKDKSSSKPHKEGKLDSKGRVKTQSRRVGLHWDKEQNPDEVILPWFGRRAPNNGFEVYADSCAIRRIGWITGRKPKIESEPDKDRPKWHDIQHKVALIEGVLTVTDEARFRGAIENGVGSGKAFGCGLFSVQPLT
jgi:CRISPR system Cascade subunit CasE